GLFSARSPGREQECTARDAGGIRRFAAAAGATGQDVVDALLLLQLGAPGLPGGAMRPRPGRGIHRLAGVGAGAIHHRQARAVVRELDAGADLVSVDLRLDGAAGDSPGRGVSGRGIAWIHIQPLPPVAAYPTAKPAAVGAVDHRTAAAGSVILDRRK